MPFRYVDFANHRVQQRRVPQQPTFVPAGPNHSARQSRPSSYCVSVSCVSLQAQYQAFVRFAVESSTALAIALNWTCVLEPFTRRALVSRTLAFTRTPTGPATLHRCCGRNVVAPGQYSKRFFCVPIGLYRGILRPATALWMPARSALGASEGVNPAAVIKPWIGPLWPCPASTTRAPPGARTPAACGISAR
jgi:hypothetical protein